MDRVVSVTGLGRSGVADWLIQRISAVVIGVYALFLIGFFVLHPDLQYADWVSLWQCTWFKVFSLATLILTLAHAWIGMWGVLSDYVTTRMMGSKATLVRFVLQILIFTALAYVALIGLQVLWSV